MQVRRKILQGFFLGSILGLAHCEDSPLEQKCQRLCSALGCGDGVNVSGCKKDCVHRMDEAEAIDESCAMAYQGMLECLDGDNSCGGIGNWETRHGTDLEYPCQPETEAFLDECGELWFEDKREPMRP